MRLLPTLSVASLLLVTPAAIVRSSTIAAYDASDSGKTFTIRSDSLITISLASNPSTGYYWTNVPVNRFEGVRPVGPVEASFKLLHQNFIPANPGALGSPGVATFTYKAESVGAGGVKLEKKSPNGSVVKTISIGFTVTSGVNEASTNSTCRTNQLSLKQGSNDAGMSKSASVFIFTNTSSIPCTMEGYPTVVMVDTAGKPLANFGITRHLSTSLYVNRQGGMKDITLEPGAEASFVFEAVDPGVASNQCDRASINIIPPGASTPLSTGGSATLYCKNSITVTPVVKGAIRLPQ